MSVKVPRSITKAQKTHQNCILLETCSIIYWRIQLITMTSEEAWGRLKTLSSLLFTQPIVQAQIKESIKAPRHRPLWRYPVNSLHKGPVTRKMFAFDDVIMPVNNPKSLRWRHNGRDSVSNHQPHDCLLNRLFRCRSMKTSKLRAAGLCAGNSPGTGEFPAQMASYAENVSIWWRHHVVLRA